MATTESSRHCLNCGDETTGPYCDECHALYLADAGAQGDGEAESVADGIDKGGIFGELISSYSRADALRDGVLYDASDAAAEVGFRHPTAMTAAAWHLVACEGRQVPACQSTRGRLHDLMWALRRAIKAHPGGSEVTFSVVISELVGTGAVPRLRQFRAVCGPGDQGEPVLTILLPHED